VNRRALLSRLPLIAALPWVGRRSEVTSEPPVTGMDHATLTRLTGATLDWWPHGEGWIVESLQLGRDTAPGSVLEQRTGFVRQLDLADGTRRVERVTHVARGPSIRFDVRAGDRKV
jgi:hypothetical protein